jgi:hypothetical protein
MFRDRLRLWKLNDKNQRRTLINFQGVKRSAGNKDIVSEERRARRQMTASDLWTRLSIDARIHDTLSTPEKLRSWQHAVKGVLDWQQSLQELAVEVDEDLLRDDARTIYDLVLDMYDAVIMISANPWTCKSATRSLAKSSAAIASHLKSISMRNTPLAVFRAIQPLQILAGNRNSDEWFETATRFLLKTTAEALPACHPTLLLMKALLLDGSVSEGLAIVYELGSDVILRYHGESFATEFQFDVVKGALYVDPHAAIGSHVDMICAAANDSNDAGRLSDLSDLSRLKGRYPEAAHFAQRCLARLRDLGKQNSWVAVTAWRTLSYSQRKQQDVVGEEGSLLDAHAVILAKTKDEAHGSELSLHVLQSVFLTCISSTKRTIPKRNVKLCGWSTRVLSNREHNQIHTEAVSYVLIGIKCWLTI